MGCFCSDAVGGARSGIYGRVADEKGGRISAVGAGGSGCPFLRGWLAYKNPAQGRILWAKPGPWMWIGRKPLPAPEEFQPHTRSEEHTSELQSRFGISYAVF